MRLFLVGCAVACLGPLLASGPAAGQIDQHWAPAGAIEPRSGQHFSRDDASRVPPWHAVRSVTHAAVSTVPQPSPAASLGSPQRHGHSTIWLYGASASGFLWTGAYTPAFVPYYPAYSYFVPNFNVDAAPLPEPRNLDPIDDGRPNEPAARPKPRSSTADQKTRAGKLIALGDASFGKQQYVAAVDRYRSAAQFAPDLAEPFFRQGHALVAAGQYENAVKAFRRGLKIRSDWTGSPFRLNQLYGDAQIAKTGHLENLAKAIETNPLDSHLLLALGMQLFFDGQRDRAAVFFTRVAQLGGNEDHLLNDFLEKPGPAGAQAAEPQGEAKIVF
jgi:hypothetical protein